MPSKLFRILVISIFFSLTNLHHSWDIPKLRAFYMIWFPATDIDWHWFVSIVMKMGAHWQCHLLVWPNKMCCTLQTESCRDASLVVTGHDDVIKWKHFPRYWSFVRGIHRSPVNSPHKGQWHGALMFSLICAWIDGWVNNREAGDLRRHRAHYDVIVMGTTVPQRWSIWKTNDPALWNCPGICISLIEVNRARHPGCYYWDYCPGAMSLC